MTTTFNEADLAGTVFDTADKEAQKKAKEEAERVARWAKLVEQAKAADSTKCQARVYGSGRYSSFHGHSCSKTAKFHREEHIGVSWNRSEGPEPPKVTRHYCGVHDPITVRARQEQKWAEEKRERDAKWKREDAARERSSLMAKAVGHLTNEQLVALESFLQTTQFAKAVKS